MSVLVSIASGNASAAATWGVVDPTSYANGQITTESLLDTVYANSRSTGFTPGAITVSHLLVKLCERIGTTGTMSVSLYNNTDVADVAGTEVTINVADLPVCFEVDANGGWISFKISAPVTLTAGKSYSIQAKTSNNSQVDLWNDTTNDNLSRCLVTTTTAAPAAGDDMIVCGEKTGAGTGNSFTVTWDITATTDFGSAPTTANAVIAPGIAVCQDGTLSSGVAAATAYVMKLSNSLIVYSGGTLNFGTSGTPVPSGSSFTLTFDCVANVEYGLNVRNLGTWNAYGTKNFTASPSNHFAYLNATEAAAQTVIGAVSDTTGWDDGDEVFFSSTGQLASGTASQHCKIATVDSSTAFTLATTGTLTVGGVPAALTSGKDGTNDANGDVRCEIANLTRNVVIRGVSITVGTYVTATLSSIVNLSKVEFYWLGSATVNKRGIDIQTTSGTFVMTHCSLHNFEVASSIPFYISAVVGGGTITISKNVCCVAATGMTIIGTTGTWTVTENLFSRIAGAGITLSDAGGVFSNNIMNGAGVGVSAYGIRLNETNGVIGTMDSNTVRATNGDPGFYVTGNVSGEISNLRVVRNNSSNSSSGGLYVGINALPPGKELVFSNLVAFGSGTVGVVVSSGVVRFTSPNIQSGAGGYTSPVGIRLATALNTTTLGPLADIVIENGLLGTVTSHGSAEINIAVTYCGARLILHNTQFGAAEASEVTSMSLFGPASYICSLRHDATAGLHKTWKTGGRATGGPSMKTDTVIFNTASPSLVMYPGSATVKLESSTWEVAVASGNTLTPSVTVRYSKVGDAAGVAYVPTTAPRLCVRRNVAAGITADTVLATHGGGADWVTLSGTTAAVTDDAILEFFVDCDGTVGSINVDDFSCVGVGPGGLGYWSPQHAGPLALGLPAGGGGSVIVIED